MGSEQAFQVDAIFRGTKKQNSVELLPALDSAMLLQQTGKICSSLMQI